MSVDSILELLFCAAVASALFASSLSAWLINKHVSNFRSPHLQSKMIGILWMVPIYSFNSIMSLLFPASAVYIDMARDCYEAYVLYLFFALLLSFLSAGDEEGMVEIMDLSPAPRPAAMFPFNYCLPVSPPSAREFLRGEVWNPAGKFVAVIRMELALINGTGLMGGWYFGQYCVVRPAMAILIFILTALDMYEEGSFSPLGSYLYICLTTNVSIAFAFSNLLSFYHVFHHELQPLSPMPKFVCIKSIIFCIFWQGVMVALLVDLEVIRPPKGTSYDDRSIATALQNSNQDFLVCFEMSIAAVANLYAFDYRPFSGDYAHLQQKDGLRAHLAGTGLQESLLDKRHQGLSKHQDSRRQRLPHSGSKRSRHSSAHVCGVSSHDRRAAPSDEQEGLVAPPVPVNRKSQSQQKKDKRQGRGRSDKGGRWTEMSEGAPVTGDSRNDHNVDGEETVWLRDEQDNMGEVDGNLQTEPPLYKRGGRPLVGMCVEAGESAVRPSRRKQRGVAVKAAVSNLLDTHFAHSDAVRDFNEAMPVLVLPTGFKPQTGTLVASNPQQRLREADGGWVE